MARGEKNQRLTVSAYQPGGRRGAVLSNYSNELPAAVESAILYEVDLFMTIPTAHIHLAPSVFEKANTRDFL